MPGTIPAARQHLIDDIAKLARKLRGAPLPLPAFVQAYYRGVGEEDLQARDSAAFAAAAAGALSFGAVRPAGEPRVRVFNPQLQRDGWESPHTIVEVVTEDMPFLVDSLAVVLGDSRLPIQLMIHPVLRITRDRRGKLLSMEEPDSRPRHHGVLAACGGTANRRSGAARSTHPEHPAHAGRRAACGFRLAGHAQAGPGDRPGRERRRASHPPSRGKGSGRVHRMARRQPLHVPRLPRVQARAHPLGRSPGTGATFRPGTAAHGQGPSATQANGAHRRTAAQGARNRAAGRDQGQLGLHRAPCHLPRLRRHQDLRQGRSRHRRATVHRLVHVEHLQHESARDSAAATQGAARSGPHRRVADESRWQVDDARARDVSAR